MLVANSIEAYKIELIDVPIPEISNEQVLIEMKRTGICGSDIQIYHGKHKYMTFPVIQGHEGSGIVVKVGKNVTDFNEGDRVTVQPQIFCGKCYPCRNEHYNVCENLKVLGVHEDGLFCEFFAVDASKVLKLPDTISYDHGAMVEPLAVAAGAIRRCGDIKQANIVVLGAGAIGNLIAQVARESGAGKVLITDINQKRLEIARRCNIEYCANTKEIDLGQAITQYFGTDGADVIIDCAGVKGSINQAMKYSRCASKIVIVANFKEPVEIEMPRLQRRQVDMIGVMMYVRKDYEKAIQLIEEEKINISELISNYFDIRELDQAYEYIDNHMDDVMKVIVKVGD